MKYAVNEEGVTALKTLQSRILGSVRNSFAAIKTLQGEYEGNQVALGPHVHSISKVLEEIYSETAVASESVISLSDGVGVLADKYQAIIDDDPFSMDSGNGVASGVAGGSGGTSSGDPMTGVKRIEGGQAATKAIEVTNPHYDKTGKTKEYNENCQRCVPTYEARRRGYDVQAKPIPIPDPHKLGQGHNWVSMYKDPQIFSCSGNGKEDIIKQMGNWGEGARAEIGVDWGWLYGGGGHVFVAEVIDGKVYFMDPQSGNTDCSEYFDYVKSGSVELVRIDNLEFTDKIKECFI